MTADTHIFDAAPQATRVPVPDGNWWVAVCSCGWRSGRPSTAVDHARMLWKLHTLQVQIDAELRDLRDRHGEA